MCVYECVCFKKCVCLPFGPSVEDNANVKPQRLKLLLLQSRRPRSPPAAQQIEKERGMMGKEGCRGGEGGGADSS